MCYNYPSVQFPGITFPSDRHKELPMRSCRMTLLAVLACVLFGPALAMGADQFSFTITCDQLGFGGPGTYDTPKYFRGVCEKIAAIGPGAFMISPGDTYPSSAMRWTIDQYISPSYVWYPAVGNHELDSTTMAWLRNYNAGGNTLPNVVRVGPQGCAETTYSFDYMNSHFVVLNQYYDGSNDMGADGDVVDALYYWLADDLAATTKTHIFVVAHEPAYVQPDADNGRLRHVGDSLDAHVPNRDRFAALLRSRGVLALLVGHTHNYSAVNIEGLWHIDSAHARGLGDTGAKSTFMVIRVNGESVTYDTWRDNYDGGPYTLQHTGSLTDLDPPISLIASGATWRYLDDGSDQGIAWRAIGFNDVPWKAGRSQLGYGDGDETTVVGYGPSSSNRYITTYFRYPFIVADASAYSELSLGIVRDDGAVVYLNGTEVFRTNMPAGAISCTTLASSALGSPEESTWYSSPVDTALLVNGRNVLAVEVHQAAASSNDVSFDLRLNGTLRGPNSAPEVDAGANQAVLLPDAVAILDATVSDDGLPDPPAAVTVAWTVKSGPGPVIFGNSAAVDTAAAFTATGIYVLKLTASDGALSASDTVTVTVSDPGGFAAFNDFGGASAGNVTAWTNTSGWTTGELMNYVTGDPTSVVLTVDSSSAGNSSTGGAGPSPGTPAAVAFGTAVIHEGYIYHGTLPSYVDLRLTGLDPLKQYTITFYGNRAAANYTSRYTLFTISDADSYRHGSSAGVATSGGSASMLTGINPGDVVVFRSVRPGADGDVLITITGDQGTINPGSGHWYVNSMKLEQSTPRWPVPGDVNRDCVVNILDLIVARNHIGGNAASGDNRYSDVNEDGVVNILDLISIRNMKDLRCP